MKRNLSWILHLTVFSIILVSIVAIIGLTKPTEYIAQQNASEEIAPVMGKPGSAHHHSTFLIFIDNQMVRFDDIKYYGASPLVHIHDYSFAEIHTHAANVTLDFFLATLGITTDKNCISIEEKTLCTNESHSLKYFVNEEIVQNIGSHLTSDGEKYVISYGDEDEDEISRQLREVPDNLASPKDDKTEYIDL